MEYSFSSVFFNYAFFLVLMAGAIYFFLRSFGQGYWGKDCEEAKYRMLRDEEVEHGN